MTIESLTVRNFCAIYAMDPLSNKLSSQDQRTAMIATLVLGVATIGLFHLAILALRTWRVNPQTWTLERIHQTRDEKISLLNHHNNPAVPADQQKPLKSNGASSIATETEKAISHSLLPQPSIDQSNTIVTLKLSDEQFSLLSDDEVKALEPSALTGDAQNRKLPLDTVEDKAKSQRYLNLQSEDRLKALLPDMDQGHLAVVSDEQLKKIRMAWITDRNHADRLFPVGSEEEKAITKRCLSLMSVEGVKDDDKFLALFPLVVEGVLKREPLIESDSDIENDPLVMVTKQRLNFVPKEKLFQIISQRETEHLWLLDRLTVREFVESYENKKRFFVVGFNVASDDLARMFKIEKYPEVAIFGVEYIKKIVQDRLSLLHDDVLNDILSQLYADELLLLPDERIVKLNVAKFDSHLRTLLQDQLLRNSCPKDVSEPIEKILFKLTPNQKTILNIK